MTENNGFYLLSLLPPSVHKVSHCFMTNSLKTLSQCYGYISQPSLCQIIGEKRHLSLLNTRSARSYSIMYMLCLYNKMCTLGCGFAHL